MTAMGARGYPKELPSRLEQLWGIRHVVVHAAGRVTREFLKRHPTLRYTPGDSLRLEKQATLNYIADIASFIEVTDLFFCSRHPDLATEPIVRR